MELLRAQTRRLVDRDLRPRTLEIRARAPFPPELVARLRELGYFGLTIPERYGGLGLSTLAHLVVQEELGRAHAAFNMLISGNNGIGVMGLVLDGTEAQKDRWLPRLASGEWIAAFALTEPNAGSDAQAIETRAVRDGERFILNGTKHYISRGDIAHLVTVFAVTDAASAARGGITAFVVEKGTPGFRVARIQDSMGSDVVKQAELVFEDCARAGDERRRRGRPGLPHRDAHPRSRPPLAGRALPRHHGGAARALRRARARTACSSASRIAEQQAMQHMLADTATDIAMLRPALYQAAARRDAGQRVTHDAAMLQVVRIGGARPRRRSRGADPRRHGIHARLRRRGHLPRGAHDAHRGRHERDSANADRARCRWKGTGCR